MPSGRPSTCSALIGALRADGRWRCAGSRRRIADRSRADDARGRDVLIEERRRDLQYAGHIVEAVGFVVLRKERGWRRCAGRAVPRWRSRIRRG